MKDEICPSPDDKCIQSLHIKQLIKDNKEIKEDLREIKDALLGTKYNEYGLIARVVRNESKIRRLTARSIFLSGASAAIGFIGGILFNFITKK